MLSRWKGEGHISFWFLSSWQLPSFDPVKVTIDQFNPEGLGGGQDLRHRLLFTYLKDLHDLQSLVGVLLLEAEQGDTLEDNSVQTSVLVPDARPVPRSSALACKRGTVVRWVR